MTEKKNSVGCFSGCGVVLLLCVIACSGVMIGGRGSNRDNVRSEPKLEKNPVQPVHTASVQRIPSLQPADVYLAYTNLGFSKIGPTVLKGDATFDDPNYRYYWKCEDSSNVGKLLLVEIYGDSPESVTSINALCPNATHQESSDFLSSVATVSYDGATPTEARNWVRRNIRKESANETFGGVRFELTKGRNLRIGNVN